jgi:hypothetical protein
MNKDDFEVCLFSGKIKALDKDDFLNFGISQASLNEKAKGLLPEDFDPSQNVDVMPVVFNLAVVNEFNKNGDGIDTDTAIAAVKRFVNKPINIEHQKHKIVGHMINASFSEDEFDFKENDIQSYAGRTEPFYITAAGFIYSSIFPELAEAVSEAAKQEKEEYQSISTSWELAFSEYKITKGSKKLSESIVLGGEAEMANKKYIKGFGGEGEDETGTPVNRLIVGQTYPLGAGITLNPAARVKGIYLSNNPEESNKNQAKENVNKTEKISLKKKNNVNKEKLNRFNNMSKEEFEKIMEDVAENVASIVKKEDHAKSIGEVMRDALTAHGENWKSKIQQETEAKEKAESNLETLTSSFEDVQKELNDLKSQVDAKASIDLFNERMNYVDATYSLTEKEVEFVVAEMKGLESTEEAFDALKEKLSVIFSHKNKEAIAASAKEVEDKVEEIVASRLKASKETQEEVSEVSEASELDLEVKDEETATLPNNSAEASSKTTLLEKLKENFTVEITK